MKVCFVIDSLRFGGAQKVTIELIKELSKCSNFDVDLISYFDRKNFEIPENVNHIKIDLLGISRKTKLSIFDAILNKIFGRFYVFIMSFLYVISFNKKINIDEYDKIFLVSDSAFFPLFTLKNKKDNVFFILHSVKSSQYLRNNNCFTRKIKKAMVGYVFKNVNLISVSNGIRDDVINNFHVKPENVKTIYNIIPRQDIEKKACELNVNFGYKYICHVGRHSQEKRIDVLLKAFKNVLVDNQNLKLLLIGNGPESNKLKELTTQLNIDNNVVFFGFNKNPYPYIKNAECLILSSEREGLPTVLLESLCLNTPIVSTDCISGPSEIMINEYSSYLCAVNDHQSLSNKIHLVLNTSYHHIYIPERFDSEFILSQWYDILK